MKNIFLIGIFAFSLGYSDDGTFMNRKIVSVLTGNSSWSSTKIGSIYWRRDNGTTDGCDIKDDDRANLITSVSLTLMTTQAPVEINCSGGYVKYIRTVLP